MGWHVHCRMEAFCTLCAEWARGERCLFNTQSFATASACLGVISTGGHFARRMRGERLDARAEKITAAEARLRGRGWAGASGSPVLRSRRVLLRELVFDVNRAIKPTLLQGSKNI